MSVATHLGLDEPHTGLLAEAARAWTTWCARDPDLAVVPRLADLRGWLRTAEHLPRERALRALARLAAVDGDDDPAAAATLTWVLLPGATTLAAQLNHLSPDIDALVAGQLWLEVRGLRWRSTRMVAATVLLNTRRGVLTDLGVAGRCEASWRRCAILTPDALAHLLGSADTEPGDPAVELGTLLDGACATRVIDRDERALLQLLLSAADDATRSGSNGGITSIAAASSVAADLGVSPRTVRRRARRAMVALNEAYARDSVSA